MELQDNTDIGRELNAVAGLSKVARLGLVSLMFGILVAIILIMFVTKFYSDKANKEEREILIKIIADQGKQISDLRVRTDTTLQKISNRLTTP